MMGTVIDKGLKNDIENIQEKIEKLLKKHFPSPYTFTYDVCIREYKILRT